MIASLTRFRSPSALADRGAERRRRHGLSGVAMVFAAWLVTLQWRALMQEAIDIAVILNALRALTPGYGLVVTHCRPRPLTLRQAHERLEAGLDRLREVADALDDAEGEGAVKLISEANTICAAGRDARACGRERGVSGARQVSDSHGLGAMSRAHREIIHLARLWDRSPTDCRLTTRTDT